MWFERACAGADLQQYVVPVGHVMMNAVTAGFVGFPQGCYLGVKTCGSVVCLQFVVLIRTSGVIKQMYTSEKSVNRVI